VTVSLVVPCYQEEDALAAFRPLLAELDATEVVLVDDGSTDGTAAGLRALEAADPRVRVCTHERNRGVGAAMRTGLGVATGEVVVVYDVDRTYPPADIARLVAAVRSGADVATASPFAAGGATSQVAPWRRLLSKAAAGAYRGVLGPHARGIRTFTCAFRAYRRQVASALPFRSDGFGAAAEMLGLALLGGARVVEVPSRLSGRREGASKMRVVRASVEHLAVLRRLWRLRTGGRAPRE
jgi:dolichol-phosphate mannosyltransferase